MEFTKQMEEYIALTNRRLYELVPLKDNLQKSIYEAMRYSLFAGGKRIRPVLALGTCEMLGGDIKTALDFACALECIHTYSLIHDDLPCMDNDDLRRGKPTCHKAFDEATALLAGDALLNLAFEIMSNAKAPTHVIVEIIRAVSYLSGTEGMIGGQVVDLRNENNPTAGEEVLIYTHNRKTGALIKAAALIGAVCAGEAEEKAKILDFAENLGLAFQIKDDILDFEGDETLLGKPTGSDEENQKNTFVTVFGLDGAKERLAASTAAAKAALSGFGEKASFLNSLTDFLTYREY